MLGDLNDSGITEQEVQRLVRKIKTRKVAGLEGLK